MLTKLSVDNKTALHTRRKKSGLIVHSKFAVMSLEQRLFVFPAMSQRCHEIWGEEGVCYFTGSSSNGE